MKEKRISIPALISALLITAIITSTFTAMASRWYFLRQKGDSYYLTINGEVVASEEGQLTIQGNVTNPKGQNGQYIITKNPGIAVYDSQRNEITLNDLRPGDPVSVYYQRRIQKYVSQKTQWDDNFTLKEKQEIPNVMAIARISDNEAGKDIRFFEPDLAAPLPASTAAGSPAAGSSPAGGGAPDTMTIPLLTVTCGPDRTEIPSVSSGYTLYKVQEDGSMASTIACGAEPLSYLAEKGTDIPYVKTGTDITLTFTDGTVPDSITVRDIILNEDGSPKYDERTVNEFTLTCSGTTASFSLETNTAAMLGSDLSSYEKGGILRGFRINCQWANKSTAEYGFDLRTDAAL